MGTNSQVSHNIGVLDNQRDVQRKTPLSALDNAVLGKLEGASFDKIVGPDADASVVLTRQASSIIAILSYLTASGNLVAVEGAPNVVNAFKLEGTHFSAVLKNGDGVTELTELLSEDNTANTWLVLYNAEPAPNFVGGQSSITP